MWLCECGGIYRQIIEGRLYIEKWSGHVLMTPAYMPFSKCPSPTTFNDNNSAPGDLS